MSTYLKQRSVYHLKHSPIIQANLDKRTTKKEKIAYLMYAYKEWLIGLLIGLFIIIVFSYSMLTNQTPDLNIRIISDHPLTIETIENITANIQDKLDEELLIDVQNYQVNNMDHKQVLMAQMAAKEVDLFILPNEASSEANAMVGEMSEGQITFPLDDSYTIYQAIHAPHEAVISSLHENSPVK